LDHAVLPSEPADGEGVGVGDGVGLGAGVDVVPVPDVVPAGDVVVPVVVAATVVVSEVDVVLAAVIEPSLGSVGPAPHAAKNTADVKVINKALALAIFFLLVISILSILKIVNKQSEINIVSDPCDFRKQLFLNSKLTMR
jgi:hypothetical protein